MQLGGVVLGAAAVVAILVAVSSGGGSGHKAVPSGGQAADAGQATALFNGLPQAGFTLAARRPRSRLSSTTTCSARSAASNTSAVLPTLVSRYVRTASCAWRCACSRSSAPTPSPREGRRRGGEADRAWTFSDIFYDNQQQENSGYVTTGFLRSIAAATPGLNQATLLSEASTTAAAKALTDGTASFDAPRLHRHASFLIGRTGRALSALNYSALTPDQFTARSTRSSARERAAAVAGGGRARRRRPGDRELPGLCPLRPTSSRSAASRMAARRCRSPSTRSSQGFRSR